MEQQLIIQACNDQAILYLFIPPLFLTFLTIPKDGLMVGGAKRLILTEHQWKKLINIGKAAATPCPIVLLMRRDLGRPSLVNFHIRLPELESHLHMTKRNELPIPFKEKEAGTLDGCYT